MRVRTLAPVLLALPLAACPGDDGPFEVPPPEHTWASVSAGEAHTCAVRSDGAGFCWGSNEFRQLGATPDHTGWAAVAPGIAWKQLAAGGRLTCGVSQAGPTYCWGTVGAGDPLPVPTPVSPDPGFREVVAGRGHVCGIATGGGAYCWGANDGGELGIGAVDGAGWGNRPGPTPVAGPALVAIAPGDGYTCGLAASGEAYCWGGQGGDGPATVPRRAGVDVPFQTLVTGGAGGGRGHQCGVSGLTGGDVYCWGYNASGQAGAPPPAAAVAAPVRAMASGGAPLRGLTAGGGEGFSGHTCALTGGGRPFCWGENRHGQTGGPTSASSATPVPVPSVKEFAMLDAGGNHTCGVTVQGVLYCWGLGRDGQLGNGYRGPDAWSSIPLEIPVPVEIPARP